MLWTSNRMTDVEPQKLLITIRQTCIGLNVFNCLLKKSRLVFKQDDRSRTTCSQNDRKSMALTRQNRT